MIERVYRKARESGAKKVVVATDDRKILEEVKGFGGDAMMTSKEHLSGTDRVFEAAESLGLNEKDIIVNVQGDEPLIPPRLIKQVAGEIDQENEVVTLCEQITSVEDFLDKNVVKVVRDQSYRALYFSRAPIPFAAGTPECQNIDNLSSEHLRHVGIYGYTFRQLENYVKSKPCNLELIEKLEQCNGNMSPEDIQTQIYTVGKDNGYKEKLRDWFKLIYQVVFGDENGPRMGFFISFFGLKETIKLLREKLENV